MPAIIAIVGVIGILVLAMKGSMDSSTPVPAAAAPPDPAKVTDAVAEAVPSNDDGDTMNADDFNPGVKTEIVPTDSNTWPGGDAIWDVARAIAHAEGYGQPGANPTVLNNPGDISDGASTFGSEAHSGSNVTHFPDAATGWNWLYNKLKNVHDGKSHVFSNNMTWLQFGQKYAGDWQNWVRNVTTALGVSENDRVGDYWNA